jgi:hypothetical protein
MLEKPIFRITHCKAEEEKGKFRPTEVAPQPGRAGYNELIVAVVRRCSR